MNSFAPTSNRPFCTVLRIDCGDDDDDDDDDDDVEDRATGPGLDASRGLVPALEGQPFAQHDIGHLLKLDQGLLVPRQDIVGIGGANLVAQVPAK